MGARGVRAGAAAAIVVVLAGCVPVSIDPPVAETSIPAEAVDAAQRNRVVLDFTIELPDGWTDRTDAYLEYNPDSVLGAYWSTEGEFYGEEPFATVSMHQNTGAESVDEMLDRSVANWEDDFERSVPLDEGYGETADGGVVLWRGITGDRGDDTTAIHSALVLRGQYYLQVEVETSPDEDAAAHELLDALSTVRLIGTVDEETRAGAPVAVDGRWVSYCGSLSADEQHGWEYQFRYGADAVPWDCPASTDLLGAWSVSADDSRVDVEVRRRAEVTLSSDLASYGIPETVGEVGLTEHEYSIELVARETVDVPGMGEALRLETATTPPDSTDVFYLVIYVLRDAEGGVVEVYVSDDANTSSMDTSWLEPFIASIEVAPAA